MIIRTAPTRTADEQVAASDAAWEARRAAAIAGTTVPVTIHRPSDRCGHDAEVTCPACTVERHHLIVD